MIGLLIIGDEILSGRRQDKHLSKAIELLDERGLALSWARYVGDDPERITNELREILLGNDLVFSFGGIGATPDDHTRACAARALGVDLVLHPQARLLILERCREMAEQAGQPFEPESADTLRRLHMGEFPQGADIVPNPYNRIPGFSLFGRVHFLPGFPVMAWPMMAWLLDERHADLHGRDRQFVQAVIVRGVMESTITPLMQAIERQHPGVKVFSLPSVDHPEYGRHIELGVKGDAKSAPAAFDAMMKGLDVLGASTGPLLVR
jgi:molybdopterin-biosynthesis enzyme MoeA-like protein